MKFARRILWVLTACYWLVLFVLTHLPPHRLPHGPANDKVEHFAAYLVLTFMLGATLWQAFPSRRRRVIPLLVFAAASLYGVIDEFTQIPVGRDAEFRDWVADTSGAAVAAIVLFVLQYVLSRWSRPASDLHAPANRGLAVEAA